MLSLLTQVEAALTPARRKALYKLVGAVLTLLLVFGVVSTDSVDGILRDAALVLGVGSTVVAHTNVNDSDSSDDAPEGDPVSE